MQLLLSRISLFAQTQILLCMKVEDIVAIETEDIGIGFVAFVVVPQDS